MNDAQVIAEGMGLHWHEWTPHADVRREGYYWECKCGAETKHTTSMGLAPPTYDFSSDAQFLPLWRWAKDDSKHPGWAWADFWAWIWDDCGMIKGDDLIGGLIRGDTFLKLLDNIDPPIFSHLLAEWLRKVKDAQ